MDRNFCGLASTPFERTPDPACHFESHSRRHALSYLNSAVAQGEGFLVVTGEAGVGKSTLVAHLVASIDPVGLTTAQIACSQFDGEEVFERIAGAFGLAANTRHIGDIETIEFFLQEEARAGRRCLLVVDEAQLLSIAMLEQLRLLSELQLGAHPLLQILLIGQPKFRSRLKRHPALKQLRLRVLASHHLVPLESSETEGYIRRRLECVGWNGWPSFDSAVYAGIHSASGGLPRRINQIIDRMFLRDASALKERINFVCAQVLAESGAGGGLQPAGPLSAADRTVPVPARDQTRPDQTRPDKTRLTGRAPETRDEALDRSAEEIRELHEVALHLAIVSEHHRHVAGSSLNLPRVEVSEADLALLLERLASLDHRVSEQERIIHHTLAMVIDGIERDAARDIAA